MFAETLDQLPRTRVRRILILRTAPMPQMQRTIEQLRTAYPDAEFWILGRQLDHSLFADMHKFLIAKPWLTPRGYKPFHRHAKKAAFDVAVMCLNSDSGAGYEQVSRVMKQVPARVKLVADCAQKWYHWRHDLFEGSWLMRWAAALEFALLPLVFLVVAVMPAGKTYMPEGQGRPAPGYDR